MHPPKPVRASIYVNIKYNDTENMHPLTGMVEPARPSVFSTDRHPLTGMGVRGCQCACVPTAPQKPVRASISVAAMAFLCVPEAR